MDVVQIKIILIAFHVGKEFKEIKHIIIHGSELALRSLLRDQSLSPVVVDNFSFRLTQVEFGVHHLVGVEGVVVAL
jgi:hypothetical protein